MFLFSVNTIVRNGMKCKILKMTISGGKNRFSFSVVRCWDFAHKMKNDNYLVQHNEILFPFESTTHWLSPVWSL